MDDYADKTDMELALIVNDAEAVMWRLEHDAADGRIDDDIDEQLDELDAVRTQAVDTLQQRTGREGYDDMREYIQDLTDTYFDTVDAYESGELTDPSEQEQQAVNLYES